MTCIITNDDGIDAPGIAALEAAAQGLGLGEVVVVAPRREWSGCGHRVTTGEDIAVCEISPRRFVVDGTPGDCVRIALHALAADATWILAGINAGGNLGADIVHSGTVAAAREAVLHGRQAIAVSHYKRSQLPFQWQRATRLVAAVLPDLIKRPLPPGRLWNVNLPHRSQDTEGQAAVADPEVVHCLADPSPLPLDFRHGIGSYRYSGSYHDRGRTAGMDVAVCFGGRISVSIIGLW